MVIVRLQNYKFLIIILLFSVGKTKFRSYYHVLPSCFRHQASRLGSCQLLTHRSPHSLKLTSVLLASSSEASSLSSPYHTPSLAKSLSTLMVLPPVSITMQLGIGSVS